MEKLIKRISLFALLSGLIGEGLPLINFRLNDVFSSIYTLVNIISPQLELRFLNFNFLVNFNFESQMTSNYLSLGVYVFLGLGLVLFYRSKSKESKFIRLFFAVNFLANGVLLLTSMVSAFVYYKFLFSDFWSIVRSIFNFSARVSWIYFSYKILIHYHQIKKWDSDEIRGEAHNLKLSSKWQRLTHHLVDFALSIMILWWPLTFFLKVFGLQNSLLDNQLFIYAMIIVSRMIYFAVFETLFRASPGKYITESIIISNDGKLKLGKSLLRTLSRHVPFEPLSYLGKKDGWHDQWNDTKVVREKHLGYSPKRYLLIFPSILLIVLTVYFTSEKFKSIERYEYMKTRHEVKEQFLEAKLNWLTTNDIVWITKLDGYAGREDKYYLKVEDIEGSDLICTAFQLKDYTSTVLAIEDAYLKQTADNIQTVVISKDSLLQGIELDYDQFLQKQFGFSHPKLNSRNKVSEISTIGGPKFTDGGRSRGNNHFGVSIQNRGSACDLVSVKTIEGNIKFKFDLPYKMRSSVLKYDRSTRLEFEDYKYGDEFKLQLIFEDSNKGTYKYNLDFIDDKLLLYEVY